MNTSNPFFFSGSGRTGFDTVSQMNYDDYWRDRGFELNKKLKEREVIIRDALINSGPGVSVLDVGCGNSLLPIALKEKGCRVSVGDISTIVLDEYKKRGVPALHINLENTAAIKLPEKYDAIIMSEVLEHTRNPEDVLRALRPYTKGFILTVPNSAFYRYRFHLMFTGTFLRQWVHHPSEHLRYWSHTDFLSWLRSQGLTVIRSEASNGLDLFGIKLFKRLPNLFGHQVVYFVSA